MKDFTFDELRKVCREIWARTNQGEWNTDSGTEGRTEEDVQALLISLVDAGRALHNIAVVLLAGGRYALRRRTDAEMDEREERERIERQAEREAEKLISIPRR